MSGIIMIGSAIYDSTWDYVGAVVISVGVGLLIKKQYIDIANWLLITQISQLKSIISQYQLIHRILFQYPTNPRKINIYAKDINKLKINTVKCGCVAVRSTLAKFIQSRAITGMLIHRNQIISSTMRDWLNVRHVKTHTSFKTIPAPRLNQKICKISTWTWGTTEIISRIRIFHTFTLIYLGIRKIMRIFNGKGLGNLSKMQFIVYLRIISHIWHLLKQTIKHFRHA